MLVFKGHPYQMIYIPLQLKQVRGFPALCWMFPPDSVGQDQVCAAAFPLLAVSDMLNGSKRPASDTWTSS